jgi:peptide chain release factor 1
MTDKLEAIKHRFEEVGQLIVQPEAMADMDRYSKLNKEYRDLEKIVKKYGEYSQALADKKGVKEVLEVEKDPEFRDMSKAELDELEPIIEGLEEELKIMLIPKDPNDSKNIILQIPAKYYS